MMDSMDARARVRAWNRLELAAEVNLRDTCRASVVWSAMRRALVSAVIRVLWLQRIACRSRQRRRPLSGSTSLRLRGITRTSIERHHRLDLDWISNMLEDKESILTAMY